MTIYFNLLVLALLLLIEANVTAAQTQICKNGFTCLGTQQFNLCGEEAEGAEDGPFRCPRVGAEQTVCFGGEVGYGAAADEAGPCLKKPSCSQAGSFRIGSAKNPELCAAYYTCTASGSAGQFQMIPQVCESRFEFSTESGKCEPSALAGCSQPRAATTTISSSSNTVGGVDSTSAAAATSQPKEPTDYPDYYEYPDPDPSQPQKPVAICQNQRSGRMSDPASCRHYYRCGYAGPRRLKCPARNLYYNEQLRMCWFRANCGNRHV